LFAQTHVAVAVVVGVGGAREVVEPESLADADSRFFVADRLKIHYKVLNNNNGNNTHAIICIHGFAGSTFSWRQLWGKFGTDSSAPPMLVAFDRPGFGLTSRPTNGDWVLNPYTQEYQVALIFRLMDHLQIQTATLIGW
jgi:pimeloyl-ACP methyl ester carboxylesterase